MYHVTLQGQVILKIKFKKNEFFKGNNLKNMSMLTRTINPHMCIILH